MRKGFTLVELSIVLVIIGLLIGGVLAGVSMTETAKVSMLIRQMQQYEVAIANFKTNYRYYPGDSPSFSAPGDGSDATNVVGGCAGVYANDETEQVWGHLTVSGMLKENYALYSPVMCGGTHNNTYSDASNNGVVYPFTKTKFEGKRRITASKNYAAQNFVLNFAVDPLQVLAIEHKLGSAVITFTPADFTIIGIANPNGIGKCVDDVAHFAGVSCSASNATSASLLYYVRP